MTLQTTKDKIKFPNFEAVLDTNETITLKAHENKLTVFYFYPKDSTPGCTVQAIDFTKLKKSFLALGCKVYGISRDSVKAHVQFKCKFDLALDLISDSDEILCQHFQVIKEKNMYGKKVLGIERSTFVFNQKGELVLSYRGVKAEGHAEQLLNQLKSL